MKFKNILIDILIFCFFAVLVSFFVSASDFNVKYEPLKDKITWGDEAQFKITITNNEDFDDSFRVYYPDILWSFHAVPRENNIVEVKANSTRDIVVALRPLYIEQLGQYVIPLNIRSLKTDRFIQIKVVVDLQSPEDLKSYFLPNVKVYIDMPTKINPSEELVIKMNLKNRNPLNLSNLKVVLKSPIINQESEIELGPAHSEKEEKTLVFKQKLDPKTEPGEGVLNINILKGDNVIGTIQKNYRIISYSSLEINEEKSSEKKGFLHDKANYVYYNKGNIDLNTSIKTEIGFWKGLFTSTKPKALRIKEEGKRYFVWNIMLKPYEEFNVKISTNYQPLFYLFILALIIYFSYLKLRSPVVVRKTIKNILTKDGGLVGFKVVLSIKNRSNDSIKNIKIVDRVPNLVNIIKETSTALSPSKVIEHSKGTLIVWNIASLEPFEERVMTYKVKAKLAILGDVKIPRASVKFMEKENFYRKIKSNSIILKI